MDDDILKPVEQANLTRVLKTRVETINPEKLDEMRELLSQEGDGAFERFLELYLSSSQLGLRELRAAVAGRDAAAVERCAHALRGSSGNVGADRFVSVCWLMEESARQGRKGDWDFASAEAEFARVRAALEPLARAAPREAGR